MVETKTIRIALAGNPNSGKTTLFNNLTGARQHVGNYPGVTIEKKEGRCVWRDLELEVVDLPGAYSLTAYSPEELVARTYLVNEKPDVVVVVLDSSNLERNLYLAVQLLELGAPLVLACNMMDLVESRGDNLDLRPIAAQLDVPAIATIGHRRQGMDELLDAVVQVAEVGWRRRAFPQYDAPVEGAISSIEREIGNGGGLAAFSSRWEAIKLLEGDDVVAERWSGLPVHRVATVQSHRLSAEFGESIQTVMAAQRYNFIGTLCESALQPAAAPRRTASDRIDTLVTNRVLGIPIFLAAMFAVFWAVFTVGAVPSGWIESGVAWLGEAVASLWPSGSESLLKSLLVDGIIGGVGNVFVFLPNILILFFAISVLEDSGYMPRAAFIMDRVMHKIGLHGKSFIPLLLGFGCTVPAIMATRTLESRRDRLTSILVAPLMSCGARLPIYSLIIPAFFAAKWQAPLLWLIYVIGIVLAVAMARLLRSTLFRGDSTPFVMELPPYRIPSVRDAAMHMAERSWMYVRKAGTVILGISILLWALTNFPQAPASAGADRNTKLSYSFAGRGGRLLEPVLSPMGFDWKIGTALIGAFAAKEVFVAQMGIIYATGEAEGEAAEAPLRARLRQDYPPLVGFAIMLFCLIGTPCMVTVAVTRRESGAWRWSALQFGGLTILAYLVTTVAYQVGRAFGWGL